MTIQIPPQNLATLRDIAAALTSLGHTPPPAATLTAIAGVCRQEFLDALSACVSGTDTDGVQKQKLDALLACTGEATRERLRNIGAELSVEVLVRIALRIPKRFLAALDIADDAANPRRQEAIEFLAGLARELAPSATGASASPPATGSTTAAKPADRNPSGDTAAPPEKSRPKNGHRSVHVYGSKFALCFNAVDGPDGVPGIMVDAAVVTQAARVYDWKNAIHIMLDVREVGAVLAVFRRWRPQVEFAAHGRMNDKSLSITRQEGFFYCKVAARVDGGQGVRGVKIQPLDISKVALLFMEQLLLAHPSLPAEEVLATVCAAHQEARAA